MYDAEHEFEDAKKNGCGDVSGDKIDYKWNNGDKYGNYDKFEDDFDAEDGIYGVNEADGCFHDGTINLVREEDLPE